MTGVTQILADYAAGLRFEDIPPAVAARAKQLILDFAGNAVRGRRDSEAGPSVLSALQVLGLDVPGPATVLGDDRGYTPAVAALLNGSFGHALDFDDTHADSSLHPSAPVVPAAFAAAEIAGASGRDVLAAVVAGYEICCRLGNALDPTAHYARGFHPTATAGVFGAAAAAARIFGLSPERVAAAFGVAGSQAAGSLQFLANGSWNKRFQVGAAAMNGLVAATLARQGFVASEAAIEGKHGLLAGYTDAARPELATAGLGEVYETMKIGLKPYPSCRYTHAALDALTALRREHGLAPDRIRRVEVGLHRNGITLVGEPAGRKRRPANVVDGQFSMYFTGAVALDQGSFGWDDYERIADRSLDRLMDLIHVVEDERIAANAPHPFGGRVTIDTDQGTLERIVRDPPGEPSNFPTAAATREKFLQLSLLVLGTAAEKLADVILDLDAVPSIPTALALARSAKRDRAEAASPVSA